jgi:CO/xanthine dehydrogenase FAD-binding subunit
MDLAFVDSLERPPSRHAIPAHAPGDAFLAGGTWLFSDPQPDTRRLIDLHALSWPDLAQSEDGLDVAATCTLTALEAHALPAGWHAASLVALCCRSLLGSFKIRGIATVGGNLCLALPAGPIAALGTALDATCAIWCPDGSTRHLSCAEFVTGPSQNALVPGELLRSLHFPAHAFRRRAAFRRISLTELGRSAALLIGTVDTCGFALTITASTPAPKRLAFRTIPDPAALQARLHAEIDDWYDDVHGAPDWRAHITARLAAEIVRELAP